MLVCHAGSPSASRAARLLSMLYYRRDLELPAAAAATSTTAPTYAAVATAATTPLVPGGNSNKSVFLLIILNTLTIVLTFEKF